MTYALLAAVVVLVLAFLWFTHQEREANARVLADFAKEAWKREQALLQRIQAPAAEVVRYHYDQEEMDNPPAVRTDDDADEDFWLAKEDLAERAAAEEVTHG